MYGAVFWGVWLYADDFGVEAVANTIVIVVAIVFGLHILNAVINPAGSFPYLGRFQGWTINPGIAAGHGAVLLPFALWIASQRSRWQYWVLVGAILFVLMKVDTVDDLEDLDLEDLEDLDLDEELKKLEEELNQADDNSENEEEE